MNIFKRSMAMFLVLCMLVGMVPMTAFADEIDSTDPGLMESIEENEEIAEATEETTEATEETMKATDGTTEATEETTEATDGTTEATEETTEATEKTTEATEGITETTEETTEATEENTKTTEETTEATEETAPSENAGLFDLRTADFAVEEVDLSYADTYRILHLDCGRKYFTADWIKALINEMSAAGYTHLEMAFGNDGLRFLLDDMSVGDFSSDSVTAAIKEGNKAYHDFSTNELTESEMNAIISHANSKGIKIIPLLNNPGHMDTIVAAITSLTGKSAGYNGSESTIDLENSTAVEFTKEMVQKYVAYFDAKGCNEFNMGADEYANDVYSTGSMGFGALVNAGRYQLFVDYVNEMADIIKDAGMVPIAFNDGIYFNKDTNYTFDTQIMVAFWTSGWSGYQSADASTMYSKGHEMINVHGDYYYVSGKNDKWTTGDTTTHDPSLYTEASGWANSTFMGSEVSDPAGAMFCIWCDDPDFESETQIAQNVRLVLRAMAAEMQGNSATAISTDVVSGGFNADGSINSDSTTTPDCESVTLTDNDISVTACGLTGLTVTTATAPAIEGAENVLAWDMTPVTAEGGYTGEATVAVPVPEGWNTSRMGAFVVEADNTVKLLTGKVNAESLFEFTMPHFSVGGIYELDADVIVPDKTIELIVGENKTVTDDTGNYESSYTGEGLDTDIAKVTVDGVAAVTDTTVSKTKATSLEDGATYIIRVYDTQYALSSNSGSNAWGTQTLAFESNSMTANEEHLWTLEAVDGGYKIKSAAGYLNLGNQNNTGYVSTTGEVFTLEYTNTGWIIGKGSVYINALGGLETYYSAGGWTGSDTHFDLYKVTKATEASTEITFTGVDSGTTYVTVGNTVYKIVVHGMVDITINYENENGVTIKTETVSVVDNATTYNVSNFNHNGKFYVVDNTTLDIVPATFTEYTVKVTEVEEDLSAVDPLTIEYWITNGVVTDPDTGLTYIEISASKDGIYSADGVALADVVPEILQREGRDTEYWQGKLLDVSKTNDSTSGTEEQTRLVGDDETLATTTFTHIRYWNGEWQVLTGTEWTTVDRTEVTVSTYDNENSTGTTTREKHQLVAYYMEIIDIKNANGTTELYVNAADWGFKSGENWGYGTSSYTPCTVTVQIVYEDGTTNPSDEFTNLLTKTLVYGYWEDGRGLGTMIFDGGDSYEIYKVTAETGDAAYTNNSNGFTINSLSWDNNEETVWFDDPTQSVSIGNPARNPSYEAPKDNLTWRTDAHNENNAILVRVYVKAVETEDTLTVVYYDEKFGDTLYEYNINVVNGDNFKNDIVNLTTDLTENPGAFEGNVSRIDVTGYGIHNALDVTQKFQTDLTQVPEAVGKYNSELYSYTGSVISEDGKTLYLYYNIDTNVLKPNFVIDFGLPITFNLSDVTNSPELVETVTASARYGTVSYDSSAKTFTYKPTKILQNIDVLSINILFDGETEATTTNVGVTPATTVHYEESFITWDSKWADGNAAITVGNQTTEVLDEKKNNFGYDPVYANTTGASNGTYATTSEIGAKATFTFTGNGVQVFANCTEASGYVAVEVKNSNGAIVNLSMVDTVVDAGTTGATTGQTGSLYGLPIVSLIDLQNMQHDTYTVTITKIMDTEPVYIDGIRVFNTMADSRIFLADKEDNPDFYELRDMVLNAIGVGEDTSADYKTMYEQVYDAVEGASALITDESVAYGNSNTVQDLLDNGPKNEIYLYAGQTLNFKVSTNRVMQVGMKAPQGATEASISVDGGTTTISNQNIGSSVDMFYTLADKAGSETTYTVQIKNTGEKILSITELKICDDPNAAFVPFTVEDIKEILCNDSEEETPVEPEKPEEPIIVYADAVLNVNVVDYAGTKLGTVELSANGVEGEKAVFTAEEILAAAQEQVPEKYAFVDESSVADTEVVYGEAQELNVQIGKVAALKITFVNLRGNKQGTSTIEVVQTADGYCQIAASDIKALAPARRRAIWFTPVYVSYGSTDSIVVPVI